MKKFPHILLLIFVLTLSSSYIANAQCDGPKGVAIVRPADGKEPQAPKAAQKFPKCKEICKYICKNMQYPASLKAKNIGGVTTLQFNVTSAGSITDVKVVKSSGYKEFDDEAVRLMKNSPKWQPAEKDCEPVDFKTQFDVRFDCAVCGCGQKK